MDMTGVPFVRLGVSFRLAWVRRRGFRSSGAGGLPRERLLLASISRLAHPWKGAKA
jgi:hypothetical protein